ncbi:MAG: TetR-like C-terminal domain-containing protein [Ilumatobacteraceae bacterium]
MPGGRTASSMVRPSHSPHRWKRTSLEATELPAELVARTVAAWTQLFGLVSFELFGQTKNVIYAHEDLMRSTAEAMASFIGLAG